MTLICASFCLFFQSSPEGIFSINFQRELKGGRKRRERNRERQTETDRVRETSTWERHIDWLSCMRPHQARIKPTTEVCAIDWELNPQPFGPRADFLTTEENWSGLFLILNISVVWSFPCSHAVRMHNILTSLSLNLKNKKTN